MNPSSLSALPVKPITSGVNCMIAHGVPRTWMDKLCDHYGTVNLGTQEIGYDVLMDVLGPEKALWCCQTQPQHNTIWRRYAVWCARQMQHLMEDERSVRAIDVAEQHANGKATDSELEFAMVDARSAAWDASLLPAPATAMYAARGEASDAALQMILTAPNKEIKDARIVAFRQLVTTGTLPN